MTQPPFPPGQPGNPGDLPRFGVQDDVPGQRPQDRPQDTPRPETPWASPGGQQNLPIDRGPSQPSAPNYPANPVQPGQPGYPGQPGSSYPVQYGPYQQSYAGYGYTAVGRRTNGLATASLVVSLAGLLFTLAAPVGIGLGIAALRKVRQTGEEGRGLAIAGIIIGGVITGLLLLGILIIVIMMIAVGDGTSY
ncbi:DUF4190 domain-containing protein [Kribbella sp. NBC_01245]|uniref:DUF4190 domain-containing protein n=1 Tax=Kribbella sp. NBC_01245 TaxID=2903578 RepID=UPI002E2C4414|nr:DUF4190 domain-containing protein [Kribbella sp. NBC_01245]